MSKLKKSSKGGAAAFNTAAADPHTANDGSPKMSLFEQSKPAVMSENISVIQSIPQEDYNTFLSQFEKPTEEDPSAANKRNYNKLLNQKIGSSKNPSENKRNLLIAHILIRFALKADVKLSELEKDLAEKNQDLKNINTLVVTWENIAASKLIELGGILIMENGTPYYMFPNVIAAYKFAETLKYGT